MYFYFWFLYMNRKVYLSQSVWETSFNMFGVLPSSVLRNNFSFCVILLIKWRIFFYFMCFKMNGKVFLILWNIQYNIPLFKCQNNFLYCLLSFNTDTYRCNYNVLWYYIIVLMILVININKVILLFGRHCYIWSVTLLLLMMNSPVTDMTVVTCSGTNMPLVRESDEIWS